jgi:hypothetical protein
MRRTFRLIGGIVVVGAWTWSANAADRDLVNVSANSVAAHTASTSASGIIGTGVKPTGIIGTGVKPTGIIGTGVKPTGIIGTGVKPTGIIGTGVKPTGIIGTGIR